MAYTALDDTAINDRLATLNGWAREGDTITKTYSFPNYPAGIMFAGLVGAVCEAQNHHPDMVIRYKQVKVSFNTHDAGNKITAKDFETAAAIEAVGYPK